MVPEVALKCGLTVSQTELARALSAVVDEVALVGLSVEDCLLAPTVLEPMFEVAHEASRAEDLSSMAMLSTLVEVSDELAGIWEKYSPTTRELFMLPSSFIHLPSLLYHNAVSMHLVL